MDHWPDFYDPALYDLEIGLGRRVSAAYLRLLAIGGQSVLELGCGTGEIVAALAGAGHRVLGVDVSRPMLDAAAARIETLPPEARERVRLQTGDMTDLDLGERFDVVLLTNDVVNHALERDALVAAFRTAERHLDPNGGTVWFDVLFVDVHQLARAAGPEAAVRREIGLFPIGNGPESVRIWETTRFDPARWIRESIFEYQRVSPHGRVGAVDLRRLIQRPWTETELLFALALAGLRAAEPTVDPEFPERWFCRARRG